MSPPILQPKTHQARKHAKPKREREKKREASQIKPRYPHHGATKGRHLAACHRPPPSAWRRGRAWPSPCGGGRPSGRKHRCVTVGRHATVLTGLVGLLLPVSILITRPTYAQPPIAQRRPEPGREGGKQTQRLPPSISRPTQSSLRPRSRRLTASRCTRRRRTRRLSRRRRRRRGPLPG